MTTTTLIFTCLPNPAASSGGQRRITIMVAPRLTAATIGTLADYTLGEVPWPSVLAAAPRMTLKLDGTVVPVTLAPPARPREALDPELWEWLLPATTPVTPFDSQRDERPIRSLPAAQIADHLHKLYAEVAATSGRELPRITPGARDTGLENFVHCAAEAKARLVDAFTEAEHGMDADPQTVDFYWANRFYQRRPFDQPAEPLTNEPPPLPKLDFHARVAALADHPLLQRKLGLVFDVLVPIASLPPSGTMSFAMDWRGASHAADVSPRTRYIVDLDRVQAKPGDGADVRGGYLRVEERSPHQVLQLDVDGGALQSADFADSVRRQQLDRTRPPLTSTSLPTLRTDGLTIVRTGRADWLEARRQRADDLNREMSNAELFAEDLLRGYRIDVQDEWDESRTWRSLCRRWGTIDVGADAPLEIPATDDEEGYVKAASATSNAPRSPTLPPPATPPPPPELYLHEAIAGWDGWSLCARRPGRSVHFDGGNEVIEHKGNEPAGDVLGVVAEYQATPRSLPRLRFGGRYRLRARTVDLAGNSLPVTDDSDAHASPWITYRRYEPAPPPVLALQAPITEGESLERLVVRSTLSPEEYFAAESGGTLEVVECVRHVVAPKCTLAVAEAHGMLEAAFAGQTEADRRAAADRWYHVARKECGTLIDRTVVDLTRPRHDPLDHSEDEVRGITLCRSPSSLEAGAPAWPTERGAPLRPGEYVIHDDGEIVLPWLPDPLADAVVIHDPLPPPHSGGDVTVTLPYQPRSATIGWPELASLRLVVRGITGNRIGRNGPGSNGRNAIYYLPPGHALTVRVSSRISGDRLDELAIWDQLTGAQRAIWDQLSSAEKEAQRRDVEAGLHWMFSPPREVMMVHAVQRPVWRPVLGELNHQREVGATTVVFVEGTVQSHGWSTSHVDVRASWRDLIDDPRDPAGPRIETRSGDAFRVAIDYGETTTDIVHSAVAETRTDAQAWPPRLDITRHSVGRQPVHELGDTRHRFVSYTPVATTRYQEYFPASVIANPRNLETPGEAMVRNIPNSAQPAPPSVLYAVPTFGWQPARDAATAPTTRQRQGHGIRIYLDRPWFTTGPGERLAVIVSHPSVMYSSTQAPYLSHWGYDPAWTRGNGQLPPLTRDQFRLDLDEEVVVVDGADPVKRVQVAEIYLGEAQLRVLAIGIVPEWCEQRKLWFADLELANHGVYWPFVSLAVARWQPESLSPVVLSKVARCHFVQVAPDRTASVVRSGNQVEIRLTGITAGNALEAADRPRDGADPRPTSQYYWYTWYGPTHSGSSDGGHRVYARIEQLPAGADPADDLRWQVIRGPVELRGRWQGSGEVTWSGTIGNLPAGTLRVVVTEAEIYDTDTPNLADGEPAATTVDFGGWDVWPMTTKPGRERIVYLDTFAI